MEPPRKARFVTRPACGVGFSSRSAVEPLRAHEPTPACRSALPPQLLAMEETWRQAYLEGSNLARMRLTGLPYAVALVSSGLLFIWLLLLPCQYIGTDGLNWASLMVVFVLSLLLLALDEVANQLEDCWYSLPMGRMLDRGFEDIKR